MVDFTSTRLSNELFKTSKWLDTLLELSTATRPYVVIGVRWERNNKCPKGGASMTRNQIAYQANLEAKRSNVAREKQAAAELEETRRSNKEREELSWYQAKQQAYYQQKSLQEQQRHNVRSEWLSEDQVRNTRSYQSAQLAETTRSNLARELETHRSNVAHENQQLYQYNEVARSNRMNEYLRRYATEVDYASDMARVAQQYYTGSLDWMSSMFSNVLRYKK